MKKHLIYWLALGMLVMTGCQKELSFELGNTPGHGSLQDEASGDCLPKTVNGVYEVATPLVAATNTITVDVDVTETGTYVITTDTVNGFYFRATGTFTALGMTTVTLRANGTPFAAGTQNFVVSFDGTVCDVQVTTLPSGAGGPATFTLETSGTATPPNCSGATAAGTYIIGTALNSSNTVTLSVNVGTIGTYTLSSTATNGMTFTRTGVFTTTGVQNVVLTGTPSSIPTGTPGTITVPITHGAITCNFQVITVAGASYSFDCSSATVNGTYQAGVALGAGNTIDITVNATSGGPYNISASINGMTFSASGTFTTGANNITLAGSGSPTNSGTFNLPLGTPPCTVSIICTAAPSIDWSFKQGTTTYQGNTDNVTYQSIMGFTNFGYSGTNAAIETLIFSLVDLAGGITSSDTYNTASTTSNTGAFIFNFPAGDIWTADPGTAGTSVIFNNITHNTATKTITGKFAGTVKNMAGGSVSITNGTFTAVYP